jgi:hypothetical protein
MFSKLFVLLAIVALAATGALEWFKALTKDAKVPTWVVSALSGVFCLVVGIAAVYGGFFADYFTPASPLLALGAGLVIGLVALAAVELCYQLLVQLVLALVKFVIGLVSPAEPSALEDASPVAQAPAVATAIDGKIAEEPKPESAAAASVA